MSGIIIAPQNLIAVRQGDSFTIYINLKKNCKDIDLTGTVVKMDVREKDSNVLVFTKMAVDEDITNGKVKIVLTPDDTNRSVKDYSTDIQVQMPDGSIHTIFPTDVNKIGTFRITKQITRD